MAEETKPQQNERRPVLLEWFKDAWSQALMAVTTAEEEASKMFVKAADVAGWGPEEVRRLTKEFGERLASQRREAEHSLEEYVNKTVTRLKVPARADLQALEKRVDVLTAKVDALIEKKTAQH